MIKLMLVLTSLAVAYSVNALPPAPAETQQSPVAIIGATLHIGDGTVMEQGTVTFSNGLITGVYPKDEAPGLDDHMVFDRSGEHVYPGFILPNSNVGLKEVNSVRASVDDKERGLLNASVRVLPAYNTDSEVIPTFRFNGVLTAQVAPTGSLIAGNSSIMQLDAWNWEDAAIAIDDAMHIYWPALVKRKVDAIKQQVSYSMNENYEARIELLRELFAEAEHIESSDNLNIKAVKAVLEGKSQLFLHGESAKQLVDAIQFVRRFNIQRAVLVGARDALQVKELILESGLPVIVHFVHGLPLHPERSVDESYERAARFIEAGFRVGLSSKIRMEPASGRNLPFMAGTAAAYGIDKEQAVHLITLSNAEILGIDDQLGSISVGKQATLFTSKGDALDMRSNNLTSAYIQGRKVTIEGMQQDLFERFKTKYSEKK